MRTPVGMQPFAPSLRGDICHGRVKRQDASVGKAPQWGLLVHVSSLCKLFAVQDPQPHSTSAMAPVNGKIEHQLADVLAGAWEAPVVHSSFVLSPRRWQRAEERTLNRGRGWIGSCAALSSSASLRMTSGKSVSSSEPQLPGI